MAKGAYIGVTQSVADTEWVTITASNLSTYFTVTNDTYYFVPSGGNFTSNNVGVNSSIAKTTLKPLQRLYGFSFNYSVSSESGYDLFSCTYGSTSSPTTAVGPVSGTVSSSYSTGVSSTSAVVSTSRYLNFIYEKDSSSASGNDKVVISNFKICLRTGTYTDKEFARKVKNIYIGVNGVARRVKKAYIGVNGIARLFYIIPAMEDGPAVFFSSYNTGSDCYYTAGGNTNYACFNDGYYNGNPYVYSINTSGTATVKTATPYGQTGNIGCHFASYALFMGAEDYSKYGITIDTSNTMSTTYFGSGAAREYMYSMGTGCNAGPLGSKYALFPSGGTSSGGTTYLDYMNASKTWSYTTLSTIMRDCAVADNGTLAVIAGGWNSSNKVINTVNTFNTSGTRGTATSLSVAVSEAAGARAGNLAIVAGGSTATTEVYANNAYSYNTSGTRTILTGMAAGRGWHSAASANGKYALFLGHVREETTTRYADIYDSSGTKVNFGKIGYCIGLASLAYVGNKIYYVDDFYIHYDEYYANTIVVNNI